MKFYGLVLGILAVWRITHLLSKEGGPWGVFLRLRKSSGSGFWSGLLNCFYCSSLWIAAPFAWFLGESSEERILLEFALSAGAILSERVTLKEELDPKAVFWEEPEVNNGVLRKNHHPAEAEKDLAP